MNRDDLTSRARIREAALELFGRHGVAEVSLKKIADLAEVSQPLILKHFGSRKELILAVDNHVLALLNEMVQLAAQATQEGSADRLTVGDARLGNPIVGSYLARLLTEDSDRGTEAYRLLHTTRTAVVRDWMANGIVAADIDPEQLAAVLLSHELSPLLLRTRITEVLGMDPLDQQGARDWWSTIDRLYSGKALSLPASP
ncbi:TetR/AcrR family transcriptional regulator [Kribbella sp. CA-293567]|uniref:TetR/AcrR family transcriptional regulator n=1 Tax=Kribbella sp. CA-293567 TaxID=3002436 RepID=UPI0022DD0DF1|nr:TetR/AcrR family transcriptional regulator [Kribbella sp. CA-293567]WBQ03914.1 TetR/AcrR family transcriptional regulator [Kribbella sp. CA-293567]